jgi:hypothetical protein
VRPKSLPENEHFRGVLSHGWKVFMNKNDSFEGRARSPCLKKSGGVGFIPMKNDGKAGFMTLGNSKRAILVSWNFRLFSTFC